MVSVSESRSLQKRGDYLLKSFKKVLTKTNGSVTMVSVRKTKKTIQRRNEKWQCTK
jgi:hypothetical protein